nr:MAG TPA: hypothetical protein [Caudoviricetes sp.]
MLKINELVASGESYGIKRNKRSAFYESTILNILNKDLSLRWDRYNLTKYIAGEDGTSFKDKAKKLLDTTANFIRTTAKKIWELIKKIGEWLKYLFKGKSKDYKMDKSWEELKKVTVESADELSKLYTSDNPDPDLDEISPAKVERIKRNIEDEERTLDQRVNSIQEFLDSIRKVSEKCIKNMEKTEVSFGKSARPDIHEELQKKKVYLDKILKITLKISGVFKKFKSIKEKEDIKRSNREKR